MTPEDLVEIEAIKRLKYAYARCIDQKLWDEIATLFTADAVAASGEQPDVFSPLAQRRNPQRDGIDPEVQILPQLAVPHRLLRRAVRRGSGTRSPDLDRRY